MKLKSLVTYPGRLEYLYLICMIIPTKVSLSQKSLDHVSINLPRLAFESNKNETYFRARLALLMKPTLPSMALRKKDISDLTRKTSTQFGQRTSNICKELGDPVAICMTELKVPAVLQDWMARNTARILLSIQLH